MAPSGEGPGTPGDAGEFRVEDRRRFRSEEAAQDQSAPADRPDEIPLPGGGILQGHPEPADELPVGFGDLVQPFVFMALAGLGVLPHPETNAPEINIPQARTAIEILELLRDRTEGRRQPDESRLLEGALYELKMQFVAVKEQSKRR